MEQRQKIVFFEELNSAHDQLFNKYLKNGFLVYYFRIDERYRKRLKKEKKLVNVSTIVFEYVLYRRAAFFAFKNLDHIFYEYFSSTPSIKCMIKLLDFPKIVDMYKKELLLNLEKIYEIELKINEIIKNNSFEEFHFIPREGFNIHIDDSSLLDPGIQIIKYNNFRINLKKAFERFFTDNIKSPEKGLLPLFYPMYLLLKKFKGISNNKRPKEFKVGITINHPKPLFAMNYWIDTIFIDDDNEMPKEDVLFIDESGKINIADYKKGGYNFTRLRDDRESISSELFWKKIVRRFVPVWFKTLYLSLFTEPQFIDTKRRILQDYILWNFFVENYKIDNYVKRLLPDNISKIQILSQHGIKTWFVFPDNTSSDYYLDWEKSMKNHTLPSFMHYDTAIIDGNEVEKFFKKHRSHIKRYIKIGVIYAQIVHELEEGKLKSILPSIIKDKKLPKKIIGVFDNTFFDEGPQKIKDGIRFGGDILRLLDEFPDIGIVFKAKKELELTPFLSSVYDTLKHHERCVFVARYDKEGISAPEVIAVSDLVISVAYTSPTAEALGAKKKAIYYDVAGRDIGDKYYYNRFPNFVAHSYEELRKLINYWLDQVTGDEFDDFLNTYVKDEIDPYLDGKALTRLRKLLTE